MTVGRDCFATVGQNRIAGRDFNASDIESAPRVLMVDESFARRMFGRTNIVGEHVLVGRSSSAPTAEIIGVTSDAQYARPKARAV